MHEDGCIVVGLVSVLIIDMVRVVHTPCIIAFIYHLIWLVSLHLLLVLHDVGEVLSAAVEGWALQITILLFLLALVVQ